MVTWDTIYGRPYAAATTGDVAALDTPGLQGVGGAGG